MSGLDQVYIKQKEKLFSLYKNNLPQSIILSGGEIATIVFLDSLVRLLPDVLGNNNSKKIESL